MMTVVDNPPKLRGKVREGWAGAGQVTSYHSPVSWASQQASVHSINLLEAEFEATEGPWIPITFGSGW